MRLAEFATNFSTVSGNEEEEPSDVLPSRTVSQKIKCNSRHGNMYKLNAEEKLLFKFNITKELEKVYHSKLMLHAPTLEK